jgi:hypothetical protein
MICIFLFLELSWLAAGLGALLAVSALFGLVDPGCPVHAKPPNSIPLLGVQPIEHVRSYAQRPQLFYRVGLVDIRQKVAAYRNFVPRAVASGCRHAFSVKGCLYGMQ